MENERITVSLLLADKSFAIGLCVDESKCPTVWALDWSVLVNKTPILPKRRRSYEIGNREYWRAILLKKTVDQTDDLISNEI